MGLGFHVLTDASKDSSGAPAGIFGWGGYHTTTFWVDPANSLYGLFMTRRYPFLEVEDRFMSRLLRPAGMMLLQLRAAKRLR